MEQSLPPTKPANRTRQLIAGALVGILMAGAGAGVGYMIGSLAADDAQFSSAEALGLIASLPVMAFFVILLHELGHLLGGRIVGFRFMLLIVGPLRVERLGERIVWRLNRNLGLAGGLAGSVPTDQHDLRRRMAVFTAGGPLASLLSGVLALAISLQSGTWVSALIGIGAAMSLVIAVVTMVPLVNGGFNTDGARLLMLWRDPARAERWIAIGSLSHMRMQQRPRDLPPHLIETATALRDGKLDDIAAHLIAYEVALDRGDFTAAQSLLDHAAISIEALPAALRPSVRLEQAYMAARNGDVMAARTYEAAGKGGMVEPFARLRVEAAILRAEGRAAEAAEVAQRGLALLNKRNGGIGDVVERDLLTEMISD